VYRPATSFSASARRGEVAQRAPCLRRSDTCTSAGKRPNAVTLLSMAWVKAVLICFVTSYTWERLLSVFGSRCYWAWNGRAVGLSTIVLITAKFCKNLPHYFKLVSVQKVLIRRYWTTVFIRLHRVAAFYPWVRMLIRLWNVEGYVKLQSYAKIVLILVQWIFAWARQLSFRVVTADSFWREF
jgi:hypothetical protein